MTSSFWIRARRFGPCVNVSRGRRQVCRARVSPTARFASVSAASVKIIRCSCAALATCCSILRRAAVFGQTLAAALGNAKATMPRFWATAFKETSRLSGEISSGPLW